MNKGYWALGGALLALSACGTPAREAAGETTNAAESGDVHGDETDSPSLLLTAEGVMADGTPESMLAFGSNSLDAVEAVTALLGENFDQDESDECGAGPMEFAMWNDVWLTFQEGEFVGWELRAASEEPWVGTPGGVTIGSPRSDLETALGGAVTVEESSLGTEFNGGGISGLLSEDTPGATVTALWAGTNCAMR